MCVCERESGTEEKIERQNDREKERESLYVICEKREFLCVTLFATDDTYFVEEWDMTITLHSNHKLIVT